MKTSSMLCASIVTLAALALATGSTFATSSVNTSRSNIYKVINPKDPDAVKACTKDGGKIGKNPKGQDACVTSAPETKEKQ